MILLLALIVVVLLHGFEALLRDAEEGAVLDDFAENHICGWKSWLVGVMCLDVAWWNRAQARVLCVGLWMFEGQGSQASGGDGDIVCRCFEVLTRSITDLLQW